MEGGQLAEREERKWKITWTCFTEEMKKVSFVAAPMVAVTVLQYLLQVISVMMVGRLGQLSLSSVAIATSLTNVTGFSLLSGLVGGLETLCGQAYGAQQYHKLGIYTYTAIISLFLVCFPICMLWIFMNKLLILIGQDPSISHESRKYSLWLIPALFGSAILKPLVRYLQSQSLILPMLTSSFLVLCFHVSLCWAFIFKLELGNVGAAVAFSLSNWLYVILIAVYIKYSASCKNTLVSFSVDAFFCIGEFFRFAIPSAVMICTLTFDKSKVCNRNCFSFLKILVISLTISTLHFTIPYGIGAAASTRVSNELGAGNPHKARVAVWAVMFLAITEAVIVSTTLFCCRYVLGRAYSNEKQVVDYIAVMTPLICLSIVTDSLQAVICGIAKGCGWQHIGAYVNLGAFYLVGIPVAVVLGFVLSFKAKGLWIGIVIGSTIQSTILSLITGFTDWQKQVTKARERVLGRRALEENELH
ncbi:unnamed protein product [Ilex paraguariensis]|uniref:Protein DETOXIFICATION n=1 Tax=Ilex paraguariensis TaxID=185542 RepID=A0ABC8R0L8_9AQUA